MLLQIHGALITLEPTFTVNTLSTLMHINNRHMLRKHLAAEFNPLVFDARYGVASTTRRKCCSCQTLAFRSHLEHMPPHAQLADEDSGSDTEQTLSTLAMLTAKSSSPNTTLLMSQSVNVGASERYASVAPPTTATCASTTTVYVPPLTAIASPKRGGGLRVSTLRFIVRKLTSSTRDQS